MVKNSDISKKMARIAELLDIKGGGVGYRKVAYNRAAKAILELNEEVCDIYERDGIKGIKAIKGVGESISKKIEECLKKRKIKYLDELEEETRIRQVVTYYFESKDIALDQLKRHAKRRDIIYSRYTKPAKQLIEVAGSVKKAKEAIEIVSKWAKSRDLDYTIETVFKRWLELGQLKPKKIVKKPFYNNNPLIWSETRRKWYVVDATNTWLEFADSEDKIEWKDVK